MSERVLRIVGAFEPEVDLLMAHAEDFPFPVRMDAVGVGNLASALWLQRLILQEDGESCGSVLFVGSAGVYRRELTHRFGLSRSFLRNELAVSRGLAHRPDLLNREISFERGRSPVIDGIEAHFLELDGISGKTNSPEYLTLLDGEQLPEQFTGGALFENMEAFGLATVCRSLSIPFLSLFALTNTVGPSGSEQWKGSYRKKSLELQEALLTFLLKK